jgi:hypothetical protein
MKGKVTHLYFEDKSRLELNLVESDTSGLIQTERAWFRPSKA